MILKLHYVILKFCRPVYAKNVFIFIPILNPRIWREIVCTVCSDIFYFSRRHWRAKPPIVIWLYRYVHVITLLSFMSPSWVKNFINYASNILIPKSYIPN